MHAEGAGERRVKGHIKDSLAEGLEVHSDCTGLGSSGSQTQRCCCLKERQVVRQ